jgi:hypothetical protein
MRMPTTTPGDLILDKTLQSGRHAELRIIPQSDDPATLAYWLTVTWPGKQARQFSASPRKLDAPLAPGVTHAIRLPGPDGAWVNLGLTADEARAIDAAAGRWVQARKDRGEAVRAAIGAAARDAAPGARTWTISDPWGYLAAIGGTARLADGTAVTVLAHDKTFYREDGMSFGAADDAGWVYFTEVREAAPAETAELDAREARQERREALAANRAAFSAAPDAETPEEAPAGLLDLPGARTEPERPLTLAFGPEGCYRHLRADADGGWLWELTWNGADGDDWSLSNAGPYIARRVPLTPERRALFTNLGAEFGLIAARNG